MEDLISQKQVKRYNVLNDVKDLALMESGIEHDVEVRVLLAGL